MKKPYIKRILLPLVSLCIMLFLGLYFSLNDGQSNDDAALNIEESVIDIQSPSVVSPIYFDTQDTIAELVYNSEVVIIGKVTKQRDHEKGLSIISDINIKETYKGGSLGNKIEILQLRGNDVVEEGKSYFLVLKKQGGAENQYYIVGGIQGIFEMDGKKIKINDEKMKFDFEKKTSSNKRVSEISDLEVLLEMISQ